MLKIEISTKFKRQYKLFIKRGYNISKLDEVIDILVNNKALPLKHKDHALKGVYQGYRDCHIEPDWILIYKIDNHKLILYLFRTGTHGDLFDK